MWPSSKLKEIYYLIKSYYRIEKLDKKIFFLIFIFVIIAKFFFVKFFLVNNNYLNKK